MNKKTISTGSATRLKRALARSALAATVAASTWGWDAAWAGPGTEEHAQYRPIQSISYEFGSKFTSGYFIRRAGECHLSLMVTEKSNTEQSSPRTAARVRLILNPGQIAGLDSEEGQSLNFACGENATALFVDAGERTRLMALQYSASLEALASWKGE